MGAVTSSERTSNEETATSTTGPLENQISGDLSLEQQQQQQQQSMEETTTARTPLLPPRQRRRRHSEGEGRARNQQEEDLSVSFRNDQSFDHSLGPGERREPRSQFQCTTLPCACFKRLFAYMISPITGQEGKANIAIGMLTLVVIGVVIGTISTLIIRHPSSPSSWHSVVSACIGYTYFTMWSVSFYPQVLVNYRRQTTAGLSVDFCLLNVIGFACYSAYNLALFFSSEIQKAYKERHGPDAEITVQSNDVAFAVHALTLSSLTVLQILYYDGFHVTSSRTSKIIGIVIACMLATIALTPILVATTSFLEWLDYLYLLSYIKIVITLIKYVPQVILNYRRKSTEGWSIWQILLDFSGGSLSDMQLVLDCAVSNDWTGITGNLAKFILGFVSIVFDTVFMLQHYIWYPDGRTSRESSLDADVPVDEDTTTLL